MSHLNAFISDGPEKYRDIVECYRDDLRVGDEVLVVWHTGEYKTKMGYAIVRKLAYRGASHNGLITCKANEESELNLSNLTFQKRYLKNLIYRELYASTRYGPYPGPNKLNPTVFRGVLDHYTFICQLAADGWKTAQPLGLAKPRDRSVQGGVYFLSNNSVTALIYLNINSVYLQVIGGQLDSKDIPIAQEPVVSLGPSVHHSFRRTTFNLYQGLLRFSKSILANENDLRRYFVSQGEVNPPQDESPSLLEYGSWVTPGHIPRHMERLEWMRVGEFPYGKPVVSSNRRINSDGVDIYNEFSQNNGDSVYISDGVWLNSDGRFSDEGR